MIRKCKHCNIEFDAFEKNHIYCNTCYYRIQDNLCIDCGKPLSNRTISSGFLNCYDCYQKTGKMITKYSKF